MRDADARIRAQHRYLIELAGHMAELAQDLPAGAEAVVRSLCDSQQYEVVLLRLRRGPWIEFGAAAGLSADDLERVRHERLMVGEGGLAAGAVREGEIRLAADTRELKPRDWDQQLTGYRSQLVVPLRNRDGTAGVLDLRARSAGVFDDVDVDFLQAVAVQLALGVRDHKLTEHTTSETQNGQVSVNSLRALARALEQRDKFFAGHSDRVAWIASELATTMKLDGQDAALLETAAQLHDVGMMGIPDTIVQKPGKLDDEERCLVEVHTSVGERMCHLLPDGELIGRWIAAHHEHWDGSGYPRGLSGEDIPLPARVIALADTYDALTSDRPFRTAMGYAEANKEIEAGAGKMFDPELVKALLEIAPALERILSERARFLGAKS